MGVVCLSLFLWCARCLLGIYLPRGVSFAMKLFLRYVVCYLFISKVGVSCHVRCVCVTCNEFVFTVGVSFFMNLFLRCVACYEFISTVGVSFVMN